MELRRLFLRSKSLRRLFSSSGYRRIAKADTITYHSQESNSIDCFNVEKPNWKCFSYEEIQQATNGFHQDNLVGRGGYAEVYRGVLGGGGGGDGRVIAVKKLTRAWSDEQREKEFLMELGTVGHVRHPNVSALLGCCIGPDLFLVFEFSSLGSVSSQLHDEKLPAMAWKLRYKIAAGSARGLHYLHKECKRRIIHRDIKASNILLTANFEPQISDFGLARWLPTEWTHRAVAPIEGTLGYLAPEYFMHGIVDEKTDVFAYGVFILEIISGKKPVDGYHRSLISWAKPCLSDGTVEQLVDTRLGDEYDIGELRRLAFVASLCIRATASLRPSMTEVLELLTGGGEIAENSWKMLEDEEYEFWGFDDLEDCEEDDDNTQDIITPTSSSSTSSS